MRGERREIMNIFTEERLVKLGYRENEIKDIIDYEKKMPIKLDRNKAIEKFCIDAKILWNILGKPQGQFNKWTERKIRPHGFIENRDFIIYYTKKRGRNPRGYILTIEAAKYLTSISLNDKNKSLILYFDALEKILYGNQKEILFIKEKRHEISFGELLCQITGLKWETQYPIDNGKYRLDFYLKNTLIVEYDEEQHNYNIEEDEYRIKYCREWIRKNENYYNDPNWYVPVIRVKKGDEGNGLHRILRALLYFGEYDDVFYETRDDSIFDYTFDINN